MFENRRVHLRAKLYIRTRKPFISHLALSLHVHNDFTNPWLAAQYTRYYIKLVVEIDIVPVQLLDQAAQIDDTMHCLYIESARIDIAAADFALCQARHLNILNRHSVSPFRLEDREDKSPAGQCIIGWYK